MGWGWLIALAVVLAAGSGRAAPAAKSVRIGDYPDKTRFVLDLSAPVAYSIFSLADPYRIVIDLPEIDWRLDPRHLPKSRLITGFRFGLFKAGTSRIVIDIAQPAVIARSFLLPPQGHRGDRLVLDLTPASREVFLARMARPPPADSEAEPSPPPHKPAPPGDGRHIVAIDPGHGGVDPGAIGVSGVYEKKITLAMARELRRQLLATGRYKVVMTRDSDIFVELCERIAIAQRAGAELFISLHADSISKHAIRGSSVYTLSETASDAEAAALAAKENKADLIAGMDLSGQSDTVAKILIDLRQRLTKNASVVFAREAIDELGKETRLLRRTHRFAGFAVLKAPDIPSVLIEMGYLSNAADERGLRSPHHRHEMAAALVRAIDAFFNRQQAQLGP